ncbi:MAG: hypothetical protein ACOCU8_00370 [Patescibacteria group bacterium]
MINITQWLKKIKRQSWFKYEKDLAIILIVFLTGVIGFGLGRIQNLIDNRPPITVEEWPLPPYETLPLEMFTKHPDLPTGSIAAGVVVASRNGKRYHLPWCAGAKQISEPNLVWFQSEAEAQAAGYTPALNCPGLQQ